MGHKHASPFAGAMKSKANIALIAFLVIAALFLLTEHWAHVSGWLQYWPYLLLLACPVMHLFMHGAHSGHGSSGMSNESIKEKR